MSVAMAVCFDNVGVHGDDFRFRSQCTFKPVFEHNNEDFAFPVVKVIAPYISMVIASITTQLVLCACASRVELGSKFNPTSDDGSELNRVQRAFSAEPRWCNENCH